MKKVVLIMSLLAMLLSLVGCKKEPVAPTQNEQTTTTVDTTVTDTGSTTTVTPDTPASKPVGSGTPSSQAVTTTVSATTTKAPVFRTPYYTQYKRYITGRGGLKNTYYKIVHDKKLSIAFMGGSVTDGMGSTGSTGGFRGRLMKALKSTYDATFTEIDAKMGGNGSQYGIYVTDQFIASKKPDLVFVDYAVNNAYDGVTDAQTLWQHYETIIHKIRTANPYADIVLLYVSDDKDSSKSVIPELDKIADKYQLVTANLYAAVKRVMERNGHTWNAYYTDNVHPSDNGYNVMAEVLQGVVEYALSVPSSTYQKMNTPAAQSNIQKEAKAVLTTTLTTIPAGWEKVSTFSYAATSAYGYSGCIQTTQTGKTVTVKFKGTDFGVLAEYAKDAGVLGYSVDGGAYQQINCNMSYSNPKALILLKNGANTEHTVTLRLESGSRMAIAAFFLNGTITKVQ